MIRQQLTMASLMIAVACAGRDVAAAAPVIGLIDLGTPEWQASGSVELVRLDEPRVHIAATLQQDAQGRTFVAARRALDYDARYAVIRSGGSGEELTRFQTIRNPLVEKLYLRGGNATQRHEFRYDAAGRLRQRDEFGAALDGNRTVQSGVASFLYDDAGRLAIERYANGSGPDGIWGSADDVIGVLNHTQHDAQGRVAELRTSFGPGQDGTWLTADDARSSVSGYQYDAAGNVTRSVRVDSIDGVATAQEWSEQRYAPNGALAASLSFRAPGPDGLWFTADDVAGHCDIQRAELPGQVHAVAPGPDNRWCSNDDQVDSYRRDRSYGDGWAHIYVTGAGADGVWFTDDDAIEAVSRYWRDENGYRLRHVKWVGAGADGRWLSADDVPALYSTYGYDGHGLLSVATHYRGAGNDGVWFTSDDAVRYYERYRYEPDGARLTVVQVADPGPDALWFNEDDQPSEISRYARE